MKTLTVATPSHSYPIFIGTHLRADLAATIKPFIGKRAAIISNDTVAPLYLAPFQAALQDAGVESFAITLPDGEIHKSAESLNQIYNELLSCHADRKTTLIALGGGVIGDITGFAAATYLRGVPFIQMPTTLLSQVDSSVGGKTAINHPLGKNMIGAFYQPQAVLADLTTLSSLPPREIAAGMAEVIKYALLGDLAFLEWIEEHIEALLDLDWEVLGEAVYRCCAHKAAIVAADETEQGRRALLNLGHTFGHAIEAQMGYGEWLHGEAVAAGLMLACRLSEYRGTLKDEDTQRVVTLLEKAGLPGEPPRFGFEDWMRHMALDKKTENGQLRFITLDGLGNARISADVTAAQIKSTLEPWLA